MRAVRHPLECTCGRLKGDVAPGGLINRVVCYCADCQAFAHFLGRATEILDAHGGTDVIQVVPATVHFTAGTEYLACMRLTTNGLLRWYAACCRTPVGNTLADYRISFAGLVHNCLRADASISLDAVFGPRAVHANTKSAKGTPRPRPRGLVGAVARLGGAVLRARVTGNYKHTPFFHAQTGEPVVAPHVLDEAEHARARRAVQA